MASADALPVGRSPASIALLERCGELVGEAVGQGLASEPFAVAEHPVDDRLGDACLRGDLVHRRPRVLPSGPTSIGRLEEPLALLLPRLRALGFPVGPVPTGRSGLAWRSRRSHWPMHHSKSLVLVMCYQP